MNPETPIMQRVRLAIGGRPEVRIFRNNVGVADLADGTRRPYGLCRGSSDLIGWRTVRVTPDMVGRSIAVFLAIEVKTPTGRTTPEQENFLRAVNASGGIASVVRSPEEALEVLK